MTSLLVIVSGAGAAAPATAGGPAAEGTTDATGHTAKSTAHDFLPP